MSTYLEIVNNVLDRLNEVRLTSSTFASALGIHASAKLGVKNAVHRINSQKWEWPFNYSTGIFTMTAGTELYSVPADYKIADWESFIILKQTVGTEEIDSKRLFPIQRQKWYKWHRARDENSEADGRNAPDSVFWYGNGQIGFTPSPDKAYEITYNYWINVPTLTDHDDEITVPENFDWVIEQGALEDMYVFLDNDQRAALGNISFKDAIKDMALILIPQNISDMRDTRVNFGQNSYSRGYGRASDPLI